MTVATEQFKGIWYWFGGDAEELGLHGRRVRFVPMPAQWKGDRRMVVVCANTGHELAVFSRAALARRIAERGFLAG